ncbi:3-oxo-5-alpha-steroid 4-dehydrogenase-domain-containing protein [Umbelopsis sp. AD052]|nr:3-oxo-5-alpha-steroid 4-dehydrogenase-domain-containing protein [Umbelopsis sp. AD052]
MLLIALLCCCLHLLSVLSLLAKFQPTLRSSVLAYGKLSETADRPTSKLSLWISQQTVPKAWFSHFYWIGFLFALWCDLEVGLLLWKHEKGPIVSLLAHFDTPDFANTQPAIICLLSLCLITLHIGRRLYEVNIVQRPSRQARMNITHYFIGIGFYGSMVFAAWLEGAANLGVWESSSQPITLLDTHQLLRPHVIFAIILFAYASWHQYVCHRILANIRMKARPSTSAASSSIYQIPRGDWFERVVCPHYLADILIYVSLCILNRLQNLTLLAGLLWTIINLSVTAGETERWYRKSFGSKYAKTFVRGRWIVLPGIY